MKKTIIVGGAAGEGINTAAQFIERIVEGRGLYFLSYKNYMSRVRGGFNYTTITISNAPVYSIEASADLFLALNREAMSLATTMIKAEAHVITLEDLSTLGDLEGNPHYTSLKSDALKQIANKNAGTMASVGVAIAYLGFDEVLLQSLVQKKWRDEINAQNLEAATYGYRFIQFSDRPFEAEAQGIGSRMMLNGNQAVALGAMAAGVSFYCAYPMAPSTGVMSYLAAHQREKHLFVEQAEDEIAAIMAAIGASSNGVRAMTGTSGGGFSLMVEALGFAAVSEVPLVICDVQRPGPATGLPTRTEQADLMFVHGASQGEFGRIILAPTSIEDAFYTTFRAFNLADKYQMPVILLTDQYLADSTATVSKFDTASLKINRYLCEQPVDDYKRYAFEDYIGMRKYPGIDAETLIMTDSHVHDEYGRVSEASEVTIKLKHKLLRKEKEALRDLKPPTFYGAKAYTHLVICWGSTVDIVKAVVEQMSREGYAVAALGYSDVYPIDEQLLKSYMSEKPVIVNVEGNATNQFGKILSMETGVRYAHAINRYDGRPFTEADIREPLEVIING